MVLYGRLWYGMGAYYRWVLSTDGCEAHILGTPVRSIIDEFLESPCHKDPKKDAPSPWVCYNVVWHCMKVMVWYGCLL